MEEGAPWTAPFSQQNFPLKIHFKMEALKLWELAFVLENCCVCTTAVQKVQMGRSEDVSPACPVMGHLAASGEGQPGWPTEKSPERCILLFLEAHVAQGTLIVNQSCVTSDCSRFGIMLCKDCRVCWEI